jgi:hypothetical protein
MRTLHNRMMNKVDRTANRYIGARRSLLSLDATGGDWKDRLRELDRKDIRGPGRDPDDLTSKGRYEISWIWTVSRPHNNTPDDSESEETLNASLRSEWTKAKARRDRWDEEWQLVQEEMRRVVAYLEWRASWWHQQGLRCKVSNATDEGTMVGLRAYAEKQAATLLSLARDSASQWLPALAKEGIVPDWANRYNIAGNSEPNSLLTSHMNVNRVAENSEPNSSLTSHMNVDRVADDEDPENLDDTEELDGEDDVYSVSALDSDFDTYDLDL